MNQEKMKSTANILDILAKIVRVFLWVGLALVIIAAGVTALAYGSGLFSSFIEQASTITIDGVQIPMSALNMLQSSAAKAFIVAELLIAVVVILLSLKEVGVFRSVLEPVKDGDPFAASIAEDLRTLGKLVIAEGIIPPVLQFAVTRILLSAYDLSQIFPEAAGSVRTTGLNIDLKFIGTALIIFLLSYIAGYGSELKRNAERREQTETIANEKASGL